MKFQFRTNVSGIYTTPKRKRFQLPFKNERPRRGIPQPRFHEWRHWRSRGTCKVRLWREPRKERLRWHCELIIQEVNLESRNPWAWKSGKFPMKRMILNLATRMNWTCSKNSMKKVRFFCNEYVEDELKEVPLKVEMSAYFSELGIISG